MKRFILALAFAALALGFVDTASAAPRVYRGGHYGRGYYGRGYYGGVYNRGYYGRSYYAPRPYYYGGYRTYVYPVYPSYTVPYYQPGFSLNLAGPRGAFGLTINP